jgi:hypothetical protein
MSVNHRKQSPATHNIKNVKYAIREEGGTPGTIINDIQYAIKISLPSKWDKYTRYANGKKVVEIPADQGREGSFTTTAQDYQLEENIGYIDTAIDGGGMGEMRATSFRKIDIYYETDAKTESGANFVIKAWLLMCTVGKCTIEQSTDTESINPNDYEYPVSVEGVKKLASDGTSAYRDANGNEVYITLVTKVPGDEGYADFENAVPKPKAVAAPPETPTE